MDSKSENKLYNDQSKEFSGPHGYGDPYSTKLRTIESNVLLHKLIRQRAKALKCLDEYKEFEKCCKKHSVLNFMLCKQESKNMFECYGKWVNDEEFIKESTKIYLEQRKKFRLTGEAQKLTRFT